ncbi:MAG: tRNA (adenosine(37)-N6)-threonylcarbamoyltransferase complex dimerization subunit type 1 TsaB [Acidobacteriia bacterium]|nr:tRNA (adenosine(37)-N6)-threonylcarbamoyltransferase complex dimerization subunit type 1 TsaB [Terriglobia bacterium]
MLILSVDTASKAGSVAVLRDDVLLGCVETESTESHSVRLFAAVRFLTGQLKLRLNEFEAYAVTTGPGSFAGLRIGVATIKGLAEMNQKPVIPVSTLEAFAAAAAEVLPSPRIAALLDAHRSELYAGVYAMSNGELEAVEPDRLMKVESFFASQPKVPCQFAGPDVDKFSSHITPNAGSGWSFLRTSWYLAPQVARLAARKFERAEKVSSEQVSIHYIRRSDAEMMFKG